MTHAADLLVVGGGIAGLTSALAAADRGLRVVIAHIGRPGEASRAAAGMLAPSVEGLPPAVLSLALEARDMYPRFLAGLGASAAVEVALDRNGILELASSDADLALRAARAGSSARVLNQAALAALEPAFAEHPGAVHHPGDGAVDNVALMAALELAVLRQSRIERVPVTVDALDLAGRTPAARAADGRVLEAAVVLLASGAWASGLPGLPRPLPVRPLTGQLIRVERHGIGHVTYGSGGYLIPRGDSLIVGATSEETAFDSRVTGEGRAVLLDIARRAAPALANARTLDHWAGLRPVTPDGLPILGSDPAVPTLMYSCGFSRNGILLAPWAAEQIAMCLTSERVPASLTFFSVERFGSGT